MKRREILLLTTTTAASLSGCLSSASQKPARGPDVLPIDVEVSDVGTVTANSIEVGVEMNHDRITRERTAELNIEIRNVGNEVHTFDLSCRSVLDPIIFDTERVYLLTLPNAQFEGDCWQRIGDQPLAADDCDTTARLAPDESWSNKMHLWSNGSGCAPTGEFRFIDNVSFLNSSEEFKFSLRISNPQ